METLKGK